MNGEMSLWDYLRVIRRRYRVILAVPFLALLVSMLYARNLSEIYATRALLEIQKNLIREGAGLQRVFVSAFERATLTRLAGNKEVAAFAAELLAQDPEFAGMDSARLADEIRATTQVGNLESSNLIEVGARGSNPSRITKFCNAYAQAVIRYHDEQRRTSVQDLKDYLLAQIGRYAEKIHGLEQDLIRLRAQGGGGATASQPDLALRIEERLAELRSRARLSDERLAAVDRAALSSDVEALVAAVPMPDLARDLQELRAKRAELADLLGKYTEVYPSVARVRETISRLEEGLRGRLPGAVATARQVVLAERESVRRELERLQAERAMIAAAMSALPDRLQQEGSAQRELAIATSVNQMFRQRLEDLDLSLSTPSDRLILAEAAQVPANPYYPNRRLILSIGFSIGLALALATAFLLETLDTSLSAISEVERFVGKPILAVIPSIRIAPQKVADCKFPVRKELLERLPLLVDSRSPAAEAYRTLRAVLQSRFFADGGRTLLVTSTTPQEGKTTTIVNLSMACAAAGMRTVLVGANMRHPVIGRHFAIDRTRGLNEILQGSMTIEECLQATGHENLSIIDSGGFARRPAELLAGPRFDELLGRLKGSFDAVLVDSPPSLPVADAATMASKVDGVLLVYLVSVAPRDALLRCKEMLEKVGGRIVGIVFNDIWGASQMDYAGYYYHQKYAGDELKRL